MAQGFKTGGRKPGTPNKAKSAEIAAIAAAGETPRDYMLRVMRDPTVDNDRRDRMAVAVASFIHSKLATTEITGADGAPLVVQIAKEDADKL